MPARGKPAYVPASMRPRPAPGPPPLDGDEDGPDEQLALLASIVDEVERGVRGRGEPAAATRRVRRITDAEEDDDGLGAFREKTPASDPYEGVRKLGIDEVEMDELLDDLSVTAAALRHRRAA